MIYTKTNARIPCFKNGMIAELKKDTEFKDHDVLLYDRHDLSLRNTTFKNFIFENHWDQLKNNHTLKILIYFADEYFNILDIKIIINTIKEQKIDESQVYFLAMDENFKNFVKTEFCNSGLNNIQVDFSNQLLASVKEIQSIDQSFKKFSSLCRNYSKWRLNLYVKLLEECLLDNFIYTFNNINPYEGLKVIKKQEIEKDLETLKIKLSKPIKRWMKHLPYTIHPVTNKFNNLTYKYIQRADFNLLIESHFDPFLYFERERDLWGIEEFSPAFPTEKTYKTMISKKPFIAFSTPFFLKGLRAMGYKTFSPYINEDYDQEVDNNKRLEMIVFEIKRINDLRADNYELLLSKIKNITDYNYNLLIEKQQKKEFIDEFSWIKSYFQ